MKRFMLILATLTVGLLIVGMSLPGQSFGQDGEHAPRVGPGEPPAVPDPPMPDPNPPEEPPATTPVEPPEVPPEVPVVPPEVPEVPPEVPEVPPEVPEPPVIPDPVPPLPEPVIPDPIPGPVMTAVPSIIGMSYGAAKQTLALQGLTIQAANAKPFKSFVFSQNVAAGTMVSPGTIVQVTMKERVVNVVGLSFAQAKANLEQRGLVAQANNANPQKAYVFSQQTAPNTAVYPGALIGLTMKVKVPDIKGMDFLEAKNLLSQQYGLTIKTNQTHPPKAYVFLQQVPANTPVFPGTQVHVTLRVKLPNVVGMPYPVAKNLLQTQYGVVVQPGIGSINKMVVSSSPMANTIMPPGNVVTLNMVP